MNEHQKVSFSWTCLLTRVLDWYQFLKRSLRSSLLSARSRLDVLHAAISHYAQETSNCHHYTDPHPWLITMLSLHIIENVLSSANVTCVYVSSNVRNRWDRIWEFGFINLSHLFFNLLRVNEKHVWINRKRLAVSMRNVSNPKFTFRVLVKKNSKICNSWVITRAEQVFFKYRSSIEISDNA